MNRITFNLANFAYRQAGFPGVDDWGVACRTTRLHLTPIDTYEERLDAILGEAQDLGFDAVDFWTELCAVRWCTPEHVDIATRVLERRGLDVVSMVGGIGDDRDQLERNLEIMRAFRTRIFSGATPLLGTDRDHLVRKLDEYDVVLALENHPESPEGMLEKIGDGAGGRIAACAETGWFAISGFDPAGAIRALGRHVVNVHLKDAKHVGLPHETVRPGTGVVDIPACLRALRDIGYEGALSIEHEPESFDPREDVKAGADYVRGLLRDMEGER